MLLGSSDAPLADQRSVMVAETGLNWQDYGESAVLQVSNMYKSPLFCWSSFCLCIPARCGRKPQMPPFPGGDRPVEGGDWGGESRGRQTLT